MRNFGTVLVAACLVACAEDPASEPRDLSDEDSEQAEESAWLEQPAAESGDKWVEADDESALLLDVAGEGKVVIGSSDSRKAVEDTALAPFSSTVLVLSKIPGMAGNAVGKCTGTLIAPDVVLTAAHCVLNAEELGGVATKVVVVPGAFIDSNGKQAALPSMGLGVATTEGIHIPAGYNDLLGYGEHLYRYDYAVIRLVAPLKNASVRPLAVAAKPQGSQASLVAYHSDRCGRADNKCANAVAYAQFKSADSVRKVHDGIWFEHAIDTMPGASGGGISAGLAANAPLFGIHIAAAKTRRYNVGVLFNEQNLAEIKQWAGLR